MNSDPRPTHTCPIPGCMRRVSQDYLMCAKHWRYVPRTVQNAVWREYRFSPKSPAHQAAMRLAIQSVS